jgi:uncharacterized protein (TIGR03437 family)
MTKSVFFFTALSGLGFLCAAASGQNPPPTATYTTSNQTVTLTGLGGSNGVGESLVQWGTCAYDGTNTNCTVTAPYTGVGGGGTITMVLSYRGNGSTPFTATSISAGSNYVTFGLLANNSGEITVSLQESTGANITFLSDNFQFFYSTESCTGLAAGAECSVSDVGLTQGATITGPVYGTFDATPAIVDAINASSYGGAPTVAPATWMEIYGTNLANVASQTWGSADFNGTAGPTILGATSVTISGQTAVVEYVSPLQVNVQIPSTVATGPQPVVVSTPGGTSAPFTVTVNATQPGLLAPAVFNLPAGQYVGALFPDYTTYVLPPGAISGVTSKRAKPGDTLLFYGIGFGPVTPDSPAGQLVTGLNYLVDTVQVNFGGVNATVSYDGLAGGFMGLYQFNVVVPNVAASDTVPVTISLNGVAGTQTNLITAIGN